MLIEGLIALLGLGAGAIAHKTGNRFLTQRKMQNALPAPTSHDPLEPPSIPSSQNQLGYTRIVPDCFSTKDNHGSFLLYCYRCFAKTKDNISIVAHITFCCREGYYGNFDQDLQKAFEKLAANVQSSLLLRSIKPKEFIVDLVSLANRTSSFTPLKLENFNVVFEREDANKVVDTPKSNISTEPLLILHDLYALQQSYPVFTHFYALCREFVTTTGKNLIEQRAMLKDQIPKVEQRVREIKEMNGDAALIETLLEQYKAQLKKVETAIAAMISRLTTTQGKCVLAATSPHAALEAASVIQDLQAFATEAAAALNEAQTMALPKQVVHLLPSD